MFYRKTEVAMIAVIFEVFPADGRKDDYLEQAARLRSELECMDGFISVERFQSLTNPDKLLSLSFWRDENARQSKVRRIMALWYAWLHRRRGLHLRHLPVTAPLGFNGAPVPL